MPAFSRAAVALAVAGWGVLGQATDLCARSPLHDDTGAPYTCTVALDGKGTSLHWSLSRADGEANLALVGKGDLPGWIALAAADEFGQMGNAVGVVARCPSSGACSTDACRIAAPANGTYPLALDVSQRLSRSSVEWASGTATLRVSWPLQGEGGVVNPDTLAPFNYAIGSTLPVAGHRLRGSVMVPLTQEPDVLLLNESAVLAPMAVRSWGVDADVGPLLMLSNAAPRGDGCPLCITVLSQARAADGAAQNAVLCVGFDGASVMIAAKKLGNFTSGASVVLTNFDTECVVDLRLDAAGSGAGGEVGTASYSTSRSAGFYIACGCGVLLVLGFAVALVNRYRETRGEGGTASSDGDSLVLQKQCSRDECL